MIREDNGGPLCYIDRRSGVVEWFGPGRPRPATSGRNFENRQGKGGRTHLVSPAMAAIAGHFVDVRDL